MASGETTRLTTSAYQMGSASAAAPATHGKRGFVSGELAGGGARAKPDEGIPMRAIADHAEC